MSSFQVDEVYFTNDDFEEFLNYIKNKDNFLKVFQEGDTNSEIETNVLRLFEGEDEVQRKVSDFYIVCEDPDKVYRLIKYVFSKNTQYHEYVEIGLNALGKLLSNVNVDVKQVYVFKPFKIGNIFTKYHQQFEINYNYMGTLQAYKADKIKKYSRIQSEVDFEEEFCSTNTLRHSMKFLYIDYFAIFFVHNKFNALQYTNIDFYAVYPHLLSWPTCYMKLPEEKWIREILNLLDLIYFEIVHLQQKMLLELLYTRLHIVEKKKSNKTAELVLHDLLTANRKHNAKEYRMTVSNIKNLCKRVIYRELNIHEDSYPLDGLLEHVFGTEGILYNDSDENKEEILFSEICTSFVNWYEKGFRSKDLNYFNNFRWLDHIPVQKE